jgi:hypothetical protein
MRATGALQGSSAAPSSACVAVDDDGSGPLPLLAALADGSGPPASCPPSATCTLLVRAALAFGTARLVKNPAGRIAGLMAGGLAASSQPARLYTK